MNSKKTFSLKVLNTENRIHFEASFQANNGLMLGAVQDKRRKKLIHSHEFHGFRDSLFIKMHQQKTEICAIPKQRRNLDKLHLSCIYQDLKPIESLLYTRQETRQEADGENDGPSHYHLDDLNIEQIGETESCLTEFMDAEQTETSISSINESIMKFNHSNGNVSVLDDQLYFSREDVLSGLEEDKFELSNSLQLSEDIRYALFCTDHHHQDVMGNCIDNERTSVANDFNNDIVFLESCELESTDDANIAIDEERDCTQKGLNEEDIFFPGGCEKECKSIETETRHQEAEQKKNNENEKKRKRKDYHNNVERRRRYKINERIKELSTLLPKSMIQGISLNKSSILDATVEYVKSLKESEKELMNLKEKQALDHGLKQRALKRLFGLELKMKLLELKEELVSKFNCKLITKFSTDINEFVETLFKDNHFGHKTCSQSFICTGSDTGSPFVTKKKTFRGFLSTSSGSQNQRVHFSKQDPAICEQIFPRGFKTMPTCKETDIGLTIMEVKDHLHQLESKINSSFNTLMDYYETQDHQEFIKNDQMSSSKALGRRDNGCVVVKATSILESLLRKPFVTSN